MASELLPFQLFKSKGRDAVAHGIINFNRILRTNRQILCCKYSDDRTIIAIGCSNGTVELINNRTGHHLMTLLDSDIIKDPTISGVTEIVHKNAHNFDNTILCTYASGYLKCWHQKSFKCLYTIQEDCQLLGMAYHPSNSMFITLRDDGKVNLYDEMTLSVVHEFQGSELLKMDGHSSRVFSGIINKIRIIFYYYNGINDYLA